MSAKSKKLTPEPAILGSASKIKRGLKCPTSCILPKVEEERSERAEAAIAKGNAVHAFLEEAPESRRGALSRVPEKYQKYCGKIDVRQAAGFWTPPHYREAAFVWDGFTLTVREVPAEAGQREYGKLDVLDVPGTADVVIPGFRVCEVYDYKTGRWPVSPHENTQLLFLALCASKTVSPYAEEFVLGIQTLKGYGRIETETCTVDRRAVEDFESDLAIAQARALQELKNYNEDPLNINPRPDDDICRFCPCRKACPAIVEGE